MKINWVKLVTKGGLVAKQCKSIDPTLGSRKDKFYPSQKFWESSWFISGMNTGNLLYPSEQFFEELKIMNHRFELFHGKLKLDKDPFIIRNFAKLLKHFFPSYDIKILENFTWHRTSIQVRKINMEISKYHKLSMRARIKNAELAAINQNWLYVSMN